MRYALSIIILLCSVCQLRAQSKNDTLFFDNFSGKAIDRTKWNVEVTGSTSYNNELQAYRDSTNVLSLVNGVLTIKPTYQPYYSGTTHQRFDFASGRINTQGKFQFTYGTVSARIKMTGGDGLWPAFWMMGNGQWPDCGEADIMETIGDSSWVSHAMHGPGYFGNTPILHRSVFPKGTDVNHWHIYAVKWTPDSLIFSIDGVTTYTVTRAMVEKYGRWAFDNPKYLILNFAIGGNYPNALNKIVTPYYGLSQAALDKILAHKAEMLTDWVLVTKK